MKRHSISPTALLVVWMAAVLLACNLSSESAPPTLVPRATATPPPTLGIATIAPEDLPQQSATTSAPQASEVSVLVPLLSQVQPDRLFSHIITMQNLYTRHVNSVQNDPARGVGAASQYVLDQFNRISSETNGALTVFQPQSFPVEWGGTQTNQRNIVAVLGGREAGGGLIVIGAHYDSISVAYEDGNAYAPGANDNASGIAALIEMARILSQPDRAERHRATIMFVAFGAEEIQRAGSLAFVNDYLKPGNIAIDAMINLDIIGSSTAASGAVDDTHIRIYSAEPNDSSSRQLARSLNLFADRYTPSMSVEVQPTIDRTGRYSDHISFSDAGYPAVRFIEMLENPNFQHNDSDVVQTVRASYLVSATQTVLAGVTVLADGPRAPTSISLRDNGVLDSDGFPLRTLAWETPPDAVSYVVALRPPGSLIYNNYFPTDVNTVQWSGFRADRFEALAIAAVDSSGLMGPLSFEYRIGS